MSNDFDDAAAIFAGLTCGGIHYDAAQGREIIEYARKHGTTEGRAAELLAEIKGLTATPQPRSTAVKVAAV